MINYSDDAILKGLKEKKSDSIRFLYREYFPMAKSIVEKNSGSYEDAEDVFPWRSPVLPLRGTD